MAGGAFGQADAEDDVLDFGGIDAGALDGVLHGVTGHRRAVGLIERAAKRPADRRAGGRDDHRLTHEPTPCGSVRMLPPRCAISASSGDPTRPKASERDDAIVHVLDAELVGVPHRAAVVRREAVPVDVDDVVVARAQRDPVAQEIGTDVDEREREPLDDLRVGDARAARSPPSPPLP